MDLKIGSNVFRNTNGVLIVQGKEQIVLEVRAATHDLLLTMDLYDTEGKHLAHLRRNAWVFNVEDCFTLSTGPDRPSTVDRSWVQVSWSQTGETVFVATLADRDVVAIPDGRFRSHKGQLVEISSHFCRIAGGTTRFGDVADVGGGPVTID